MSYAPIGSGTELQKLRAAQQEQADLKVQLASAESDLAEAREKQQQAEEEVNVLLSDVDASPGDVAAALANWKQIGFQVSGLQHMLAPAARVAQLDVEIETLKKQVKK